MLVEKYTGRTLGITSTRMLVEAGVAEGSGQAVGLVPHRLVQEGEIQVTPIRERRKYSGQASMAYDIGKNLWVVSSGAGTDTLQDAGAYRDQWSGVQRLPRFRAVTTQPIRTSMLVPLLHANQRVFGVAWFETVERLDITGRARRELAHLALALSIANRLYRDTESRGERTATGLSALDETLSRPLIKLTKPSIFVASSERGEADVVSAMRAVIKERSSATGSGRSTGRT